MFYFMSNHRLSSTCVQHAKTLHNVNFLQLCRGRKYVVKKLKMFYFTRNHL